MSGSILGEIIGALLGSLAGWAAVRFHMLTIIRNSVKEETALKLQAHDVRIVSLEEDMEASRARLRKLEGEMRGVYHKLDMKQRKEDAA